MKSETYKLSTQNHQQLGFTLVELMITLAIAATLATVAIPSFTTMIQNNRITTQANQFIATMNLARSEAIKRGTSITVTATSGDANWDRGWTVAVGATQLKVISALDGSSALVSGSGNSEIIYLPTGRANVTDSLTLCDDRTGETGRTISISTTGRISVSDLTCG